MKSYPYELAICAIFQNESPFLREWIEFHHMLGVGHFWLYNNNSTDAYLSALEPYIQNGVVDLLEWRTAAKTPIKAYQADAYNHCLTLAVGQTKWLAFIDLDEYIVPTQRRAITALLPGYEDFSGVFLYWQMFGTSGLLDLPEGELMTESLLYRAETDYKGNLDGKTICRPEQVLSMTVHEACYSAGKFAVDALKRRHPSCSVVTTPLRIHHYFTRTERYLRDQKIPRRCKVEERDIPEAEIARHLQKLNAVEDRTALQYAAELRRQLTKRGYELPR